MTSQTLGYPGLKHNSYTSALSPDGTLLASGGDSGSSGASHEVMIWSWPEGAVLHRVRTGVNTVNTLSWSADSQRLVVADYNSHVHLYDLSTQTLQQTKTVRGGPPAGCVRFGPNGNVFFCASHSTRHVFELDGHTLSPVHKHPLAPEQRGVDHLLWIQGALVTVDRDRSMQRDAEGHWHPIERPVVSEPFAPPHPERVCPPGDPLNPTGQPHPQTIVSLAFSPDGQALACGDANGGLFLYTTATGALIAHTPLEGRVSVAWTPEGLLLSASLAGLRRHQPETLETLKTLRGKMEGSLDVSCCGQWVAAQLPKERVKVWDLKRSKPLYTLKECVSGARFTGTGQHLVTIGFASKLTAYESATGTPVGVAKVRSGALCAHPKGVLLSRGREMQVLSVPKLRASKAVKLVKGSSYGAESVACRGDLWATNTNWHPSLVRAGEATLLPELSHLPAAVALRPDGQQLAVGGGSDLRLIPLSS